MSTDQTNQPKPICDEFYLRDTRSDVGSTCMFWAKDGRGYASDLRKAEVFSHEEAQKYADRQDHFVPLSKAAVDAVATIRVDMQLLKLNCDFSKGIVIHRRFTSYDGNDIFFDDGEGGCTADYNEAKVYAEADDLAALPNQYGAVLSKAFLDTICRPTIQQKNINHRKMITAAGIKYRSPRKKRTGTGKTRGNCPECGKITWDYNPHENAYCDDHSDHCYY